MTIGTSNILIFEKEHLGLRSIWYLKIENIQIGESKLKVSKLKIAKLNISKLGNLKIWKSPAPLNIPIPTPAPHHVLGGGL